MSRMQDEIDRFGIPLQVPRSPTQRLQRRQSHGAKLLSFEEGIAILDRVLAHRANAYCATTIEDGEIVSICCNSPLMPLHPVISARLVRREKVGGPKSDQDASAT